MGIEQGISLMADFRGRGSQVAGMVVDANSPSIVQQRTIAACLIQFGA